MRRAHYDLVEHASEYREYAESGQVYDEYRKGYVGGSVEYRYADFLLALGEAIMMNRPRFTVLLHAVTTARRWCCRRMSWQSMQPRSPTPSARTCATGNSWICARRRAAVADPFAGKGAAGPADRPDHAPPYGRLCPAGCQRSRRLQRASQR